MKPNKMKSKTKLASGVQKRAKRGIHVKGKWKAIELDPSLFSEEGMEGLVCFEELTNYRLVDPEKTAVEAAKALKKKEKKKAQKRKAKKTEEDEVVEEEGSVIAETPKKKAKKKEKKQSVGETSQTDPPSTDVTQTNVAGDGNKVVDEAGKGDISEELAISSEQTTQSKPAKKKKKKEKKMKKQVQQVESSAVVEGQSEESPLEDQTMEKASKNQQTKLPKKRAKNWTNAALSSSNDKNTDMSAWKHLFVPAPVLKALSSLGFSSPTPIQALALPPAIRDRMDILGAAETGSGKTLAFGIPMIHTILEWRKDSDKSVNEDAAQPKNVESLYLQDDPTTSEPVASSSSSSNESTSKVDDEEEGDGDEEEGDGDEEEGDGDEEEGDGDEEEGDGDEEEGDGDEDDGDEEEGDDEDLNEEDDSVDEADEDQTVGCVKVVDNADFDFDPTAEAEEKIHIPQKPLLGLVLTPTRELAVQVKHHIDAVAKFTDIKAAIVVGGMSQQKQRRMLKHRPEIIIATPGRLWELIKERHPHLLNLRQLRCLVIDEADRMVERGHFAELESLLEMLHTVHFNPTRQMFVFSATLTMVYSLPTRVVQKRRKLDQRSKLEILMEKVGIKSKPKIIDLTRKEATAETLTETQIHCQKEEKDFFLYYFLLQHPGRTMVFANSIDCIKRLNSLLVILDCNPLPLHANMHQKQRLKNLERFAERESCVLLTTDVAARGLDIPNIQHVFHYQVPRTSETYVHRSGRTARATKEGLSLLLIGPDDVMNFKKIYRTLGKDEELPMFPIETKCMEAIKERVNLARKIEKIEFHNSKQKQHNSWFRRAADALEIDLDDELLMGKDRDEETDRQQQRMVKEMKAHLKHLISQPVFKSVMKTKYPTQMGKFPLHQMALPGKESALNRISTEQQRNKNVRAGRKQKKKEQKQ